jgi:hypothetical protein
VTYEIHQVSLDDMSLESSKLDAVSEFAGGVPLHGMSGRRHVGRRSGRRLPFFRGRSWLLLSVVFDVVAIGCSS